MSLLLTRAGKLIDRIKINSVTRIIHRGEVRWLKQRRPLARLIIPLANAFFRIARNPVVILGDAAEWQAWECECLRLLHDSAFAAEALGGDGLLLDEIPGRSLSHHLDQQTVTPQMFAAAARELRRVHEISSDRFGGPWSHGDPHTGNLIFEPEEGIVRLMDFEVRHLSALTARQRHTDDLLVFLQDTLGRLPRDRWLDLAEAFVRAYARPEITEHLIERLAEPRGVAKLWWAVRTTYLHPTELSLRLSALRRQLAAIA
jgi:hypothetical protein